MPCDEDRCSDDHIYTAMTILHGDVEPHRLPPLRLHTLRPDQTNWHSEFQVFGRHMHLRLPAGDIESLSFVRGTVWKLTIGLKPCCIASRVVALTQPEVLTPHITSVSTLRH